MMKVKKRKNDKTKRKRRVKSGVVAFVFDFAAARFEFGGGYVGLRGIEQFYFREACDLTQGIWS